MRNHKSVSPLLLLLVFSATLSITAYLLTKPMVAHEAYPLPLPQAPACYVAATSCESIIPPSTIAQQPTLVTRATLTETLTETLLDPRPFDGKSWLPRPTALVSAAELRGANRQPLSDVPCVNGFADVFPCDQVDLLAFLPHTMIGGDTNNDMWGWTDPATGIEYAMVGARDGVAFVDISNPIAPRYLGKLPTHAMRSSWRDLKVYQDHLFVVADRNPAHGMQVFDLAQLRTLTTTAAATTTAIVFSETAHYAAFSDAHNLAINEASGYAYAVGGETCNSGLHMINIQDVNAPVGVGCYSEDGYIHDTQCVIYHGPDPAYQGRELCFNSSVGQFTIVDVSDKSTPTRLSAVPVDGTVYIHQGWLTPDQRYFLLDDEMDEMFGHHNTRTYIFDVSDIDAPRFVNAYTAAVASIDHNLYISGTYAYEANYTSGLRILDLQDLAQGSLTEAAFFDVYPENNEPVFAGAWTAYPYYKSGVVAISTLDRGLFLVRPQLEPDVVLNQPLTEIAFCATETTPPQFEITFDLLARNQYTQVVELRTAQLPAAATGSFAPAQVDLGATTQATSTLTVDVAAVANGAYTFTAEVVSAAATVLDQATVQLHLASTPGMLPTLQAPITTTSGVTDIAFTWSSDPNVTRYTLELAADADFATSIYTATVTNAEFLLPSTLAYDQIYYWRIQPHNGCGAGTTSATGQFRTPIGLFLPVVRR